MRPICEKVAQIFAKKGDFEKWCLGKRSNSIS